MDTFLLKNLSDLLQTGIFYVEKSGLDDSWKTDEMNPLISGRRFTGHAAPRSRQAGGPLPVPG